MKILIVGGYGTFGGRIVELLETDTRLTLIVAGRSEAKAKDFCAARSRVGATLVAAAFDRDGNLDAQIFALKPDILVDASGPFQAYGDDRYRVIRACIDRSISYLDLADGSDFVAGVSEFDAAACKAGVFILSGVSSFPVLTAAVVRHLAVDMDEVRTIHGGIAPSPFAGVGQNVIRAIAGYAGQTVGLIRDGKPVEGYPLTEQMRYTIAPPGRVPLDNRLFSLVDVPDLRALTELWPRARTIWMGAAPVPEILHRALIALARLVRAGWVRSLSPLAPLMHLASNHLRWGENRGGMFVEVEGTDTAGRALKRSWHLLAEGQDGPLIPSMAVQAIVLAMLDGKSPAPGARAALRDLELADYDRLFAGRAISTGTRSIEAPMSLYAGLLGTAFEVLPEPIRAMHRHAGTASGIATVERGRNPLARLAAWLTGFPPAGAGVPVTVRFERCGEEEIWTRTFGGHRFFSHQFAGKGRLRHLLCERFGPLTFAIAILADAERLTLVLRHWRLFNLPLPMTLCPRSTVYETVEDGTFRFHVEISHAFTGLIVRYRGWLAPPVAG